MNYIARKSQEYLRKKGARKKINRVKKKSIRGQLWAPFICGASKKWGSLSFNILNPLHI